MWWWESPTREEAEEREGDDLRRGSRFGSASPLSLSLSLWGFWKEFNSWGNGVRRRDGPSDRDPTHPIERGVNSVVLLFSVHWRVEQPQEIVDSWKWNHVIYSFFDQF